jgi:hypothetical protein
VHGAETLAPKYRDEAMVRAEQLATVIRELQRNGYSMRGIAAGRAFPAADCSSARQMSSAVGTCADPLRASPAVDASLSSGVVGVAPACASADAFANASAQASSGPATRGIAAFGFNSTIAKRAGRRTGFRLKVLKRT